MLHRILIAFINASQYIVTVWRGAAYETVPKISKSDMLQHADVVGKPFI